MSLLQDVTQINTDFANSVYTNYKQMRFGIDSCVFSANDWDDDFDYKKLLDYQVACKRDDVSIVDIRVVTDLSVLYNGGIVTHDLNEDSCNTKVEIQYPNSDQDIVEVNSNGCLTRININGVGGDVGYVFTQDTPSTTWIILHNLGYVPNVFLEDELGRDMDGIKTPDPSQPTRLITITFSRPKAGKAYLS